MPPTPSPIPVTVVAPPPEWWQIVAALSPFAVLIGAVVAGIIGFRQIKQKREADNRAEWWKRTQWALDAVYSGDPKRGTVGLKVLTVLAESGLAGEGELDVLEAAWENPLSEAEKQQTENTAKSPLQSATPGTFVPGRPAPSVQRSQEDDVLRDGQLVIDERGAHVFGVDDEPRPRDNEEDDKPQPAGGGPR
ncbi:hypothetical protein [Arthrobacter sp. SLBN-122]|uniref:hypothetical protein n=1 Tax=Arthrobacter sp. SLBN-122 TaxID=2768455 RepID=UPI0011539835|nr:hypothetical protein [Arthrobacter sp. SLBN-122]TQJ36744.1 hypothetical protein FBY36_4052 [Arthrobacter sp. SLBN-122]